MPHQNVAIIGASAVGLYAAYLLAREGILDNVGYDDFLRLLNRQARDVMEVRTRDELARALWRLVLAQPQWIMLVTRAFFTSPQKIVSIGRNFLAFFRYIVGWDYKVLVIVTSARRTAKHVHGN